MILAAAARGQTSDPYAALRAKDYATAVRLFEQTLALNPLRVDLHKDLAYTLLKIGETEAARDQFAEAMTLDKADDQAALEYAFLCYETKQAVEARRVFDRLRREAGAQGNRETAAQAFENIDRPLREGITRWLAALAVAPENFSAHEEVGRLAEGRDDFALASEHIEKAWRMRSSRRDLLLDLGRVWAAAGRAEDAHAALLAASRSGESPRNSEQALELLPARYPYVYEFEKALALDSANVELRRELAYLHLQMGNGLAAEGQFATVIKDAPEDLLSTAQLGFLRINRGDQGGAVLLDKVLAGDHGELAERVREVLHLPKTVRESRPRAPSDAKLLADRSLEKGYLSDALMYLHAAHETDPGDFNVTLKLGRTYNILRDDHEAVRWFGLARRSPEPDVAREAARAYRNLAPALRRVRTTVWAAPMYSSRWHDTFAYAQIKTEFVPRGWLLRPYASVRFIGDTRGAVMTAAGLGPQYLSERSAIVGLGVTTPAWRGLSGWFEAGESLRVSHAIPDYRGGAAFARGLGAVLARGSHGWFAETNNDAVFVSRFGNDTLGYSQNRAGYTWRGAEGAGGLHAQMYWNANVTGDLQGQAWANFAESGPGLRFRFEALPVALMFTINALHGVYLMPQYGVRRANFNDLRIGVWYAVTH
jgi:tetratricopeptide (TPR) repeat protein